MKKRMSILCTLLVMIFTLVPHAVSAMEVERNMVYSSKSKQETIYQLTQNDSFDYFKALEYDNLKIVKESITVVYTVDMHEYAETGQFNLKPMVKGVKQNTSDGNVYIAKVVTAENAYGGNIMFYIEDGVAYNIRFTPSITLEQSDQAESKTKYMASCSYVDHAARIQNILKESDPVSVYDVKYVAIDEVGDCFYINNNANQVMIPVGYHNVETSSEVDIALNQVEFKKIAEDILNRDNDLIAIREAWEKEHPGEKFDMTGCGSVAPAVSGCSHVDNIIEIFKYIEIDMNTPIYDDIADTPNNVISEPSHILLWSAIFAGVIVLIVCVVFLGVFVYKKKI